MRRAIPRPTAALPVTIDTTICNAGDAQLQPGSESGRQHQRQPDQRHDAVTFTINAEHCDGRRHGRTAQQRIVVWRAGDPRADAGRDHRRLDHADGGHAGRWSAQHLGQAERCVVTPRHTAAVTVTIDTTIATLNAPRPARPADGHGGPWRQHQRQPDQRHDAPSFTINREHCDGRRTRSNCSTTDRRLARR